ncbi:helix-turn-helix transcriptional regulator [Chiayiivirga flava]|uniref:HTH-type transcriptional regulator/antitoxin HipB n=1 Tax=Chiayiivirga flava TaxID=659595 RepID=A0A7W8G1L1_9GAMM|nr:helix-turn-helix domain-containing protein [Chiayiivirga flava]MBB5207755.1 HTH-type transcriptional regulator/antitoxin HipB [Chiayiivirga flava]
MSDIPLQLSSQLGPILRAVRKSRGLTQQDLARQLGVTRQAISLLEQRPEAATLERLMRVFALLQVDVLLRPRDVDAAPAADW